MLAAELSGKTGVSISAPYANENSRIILSAADIAAENGKIKLQSYGDQSYYAGQGELYTLERRSYKTGKWYNRKHITEVKEHKNAKPDAVTLSASQGIDIKSGGSIDAYATAFDAPKGSINIEAGRKLTLYAVEELNYDKLDSQKRRKFIGITYDKVHDTTTHTMKTALPSRVVAESANLQSGWDAKLQGTQFETTLGGAVIRAGVGDQARADAKIILEGIKSSIHTETVSSSKSALWQKQAGRGSYTETLQLPSFKGQTAPVLTAPGGYIADIPQGNLKTQIETLTKQPEYAYLKQLQTASNTDWNQISLAYDRWNYKQEGMTPAAAAVVVIVVTLLTYGALSAPAAAGTAGAAGVGAGGAAAGTAAGTGVAAGTAATTGVAAGTSAAAITTAAGQAALASLASQKEQQKWIRENPEEYREVLLLQTGFIPIIGDIQNFVQAQTAADYLFALLGVVPGIGESIQAYKVAKAAKNLQGMKKALDKAATVATAQGYISKTKIKVGQTELKVTAATDKQLLKTISEGRDTTGKMTEQLFDSLAKQNGFKVLSGGKYGGNNGFDHVWQAADGSVVLIVESKQIRNGTVQLNPNGAGGYTQMSEDWIRQVITNLPDNHPTKNILREAVRSGKIKTAVTGVDRQTGKAVIIPVKVPSKANIRR